MSPRNQQKAQKCYLSRQIMVRIIKCLPRVRFCKLFPCDHSILITLCRGHHCNLHFVDENSDFEVNDPPKPKCADLESRDLHTLLQSWVPAPWPGEGSSPMSLLQTGFGLTPLQHLQVSVQLLPLVTTAAGAGNSSEMQIPWPQPYQTLKLRHWAQQSGF